MRTALAVLLALATAAATAAPKGDDESRILKDSAREDSGTTYAPPPDDDDVSVTYTGLGVARVATEFENLNEAINLQVVLGFRIPTVKWFGVELDLQTSVIPGENEGTPGSGFFGPAPSGNYTNDPDEFGMQGAGLSGVVRSTGRFYGMGRYGYRYLQTSISELNEERSGNAWGVGAGYRWNTRTLSGVELGYHRLAPEIDYLGLMFSTSMDR